MKKEKKIIILSIIVVVIVIVIFIIIINNFKSDNKEITGNITQLDDNGVNLDMETITPPGNSINNSKDFIDAIKKEKE